MDQPCLDIVMVPPAGDRVGEFLRTSREARDWTLEQVSRALRISVENLEAIEASRFGALPEKPYVVGFVRAYASLLEVNVEAVLARLRSEMAHVPDQQDLVFPEPPSERKIPTGALISVSLCVLIAAYATWYYQTAQHHVRRDVVAQLPTTVAEPAPHMTDARVAAALPPDAPVRMGAPVSALPTTPPVISPAVPPIHSGPGAQMASFPLIAAAPQIVAPGTSASSAVGARRAGRWPRRTSRPADHAPARAMRCRRPPS